MPGKGKQLEISATAMMTKLAKKRERNRQAQERFRGQYDGLARWSICVVHKAEVAVQTGTAKSVRIHRQYRRGAPKSL